MDIASDTDMNITQYYKQFLKNYNNKEQFLNNYNIKELVVQYTNTTRLRHKHEYGHRVIFEKLV